MASVNVNRILTDQFYRYKMPKLIAKVEGKGNGIKTVIVNMVEIAKALNRPPMYPTKYFGCVLGAQVNCDNKNERYIVNGAHDSNKLQDLLDGFIQKYVLCASCENPETVLAVSQKRGVITTSCKACGYSGTLNGREKLATYIIKYPPNQQQGPGPSLQQSSKKSKRKGGKDDKKSDNDPNQQNGDSDELNDNSEHNGKEDEDWCEDTNADAVAKRMEELSLGAKGLMHNDDLEKSQEERLQMFFDFIKQKKNGTEGPIDVAVQKEIVAEAERLDIRDKAVIVLCELLFNDPAKILMQIKNNRNLFIRFTMDNPKAQKYLLRGFELTVKEFKNNLVPRVPHVLKAFYDADILDEKVLLEWGSKVQKKSVGKDLGQEIFEKAQPFIKWLKEAEEEESSEEEEEEVEVVYDDRHIGTGIKEVKEIKTPPPAVVKPKAPEGDDIDIDAI